MAHTAPGRPGYSDLATLKAWADTRDSDSELPRLIRRLILETTPGLVRLGVPAGDDVSTGGWDGIVETSEGSPWVPTGSSLWELSTNKRVGTKADSDYDKRVKDPLVDNPLDHSYIAVSLRTWAKQDLWAKKKAEDDVWGDVRAYGADKIQTWLEHAPATWAWFSELNGLAPYGVRTISAWWTAWSAQTDPAFTPGVVLAGRERDAQNLADRFASGDGFTLTVGAPSHQDACAFIAATALDQENSGNGDVLARAVVVDELNAWRRLIDSQVPLILIPMRPDLATEIPPDSPHQVVVPMDRPDTAAMPLAPIDGAVVKAALVELGVDEDAAAAYGRLARRSLTALRRRLGDPALSTPFWSNHPVSRVARACLLAGSWADTREGDREVLSELTGLGYDEVVEAAEALASGSDPMISFFDSSWHLIDPLDAWTQMGSTVTPHDLERLVGVMSIVLGEIDPALGLPQSERWWRAAFDGIQRTYSDELRSGLAHTLALLGEFGEKIPTSGGGTAADLAGGVVRRLLTGANGDQTGQAWSSLADLLPLLAEAAPDAFLDGVRDGLSGDEPLLANMFLDQGDSILEPASPHSGLLWALETLAWSADHLRQVTELLARLAEVDPGGRMMNRPANSLAAIFMPSHPGNTASDESRLLIIDAIGCRHPNVFWRWLMAMLPEAYSIHLSTHAPEYREWKPVEQAVTLTAHLTFVSELVDRSIKNAAGNAQRWLELIDKLDNLPANERMKILVGLKGDVVNGDIRDEEERTRLRDRLRAISGKHRTFADTSWAIKEDQLAPIDELAEALTPTSAHAAYRWLFAEDHPYLAEVAWSDDLDGFNLLLSQRRASAVEAILSEEGLDGVWRLAHNLNDPSQWSLGVALADTRPSVDQDLLVGLVRDDTIEQVLSEAYFTRRFINDGWPWLDEFLATAELTSTQSAQLLLCSRDFPTAWKYADESGNEVASDFWRRFRPFGLGGGFEHTQYAARRLLDAGQYAQALLLIYMYSRNGHGDQSVLAQLATEGLSTLLQTDADQTGLARLSNHGLTSLFGLLERQKESVGVDRVASLEWAYLPALGYEPAIPSLSRALSESPELFVQVIRAVYGPNAENDGDGGGGPVSGGPRSNTANAANSGRLLTNWNCPPGLGADGLDEAEMNHWVDDVLPRLVEARVAEAGSLHIGHVLTHVPPGPDGIAPPIAVRDLIERLDSRKLEEGYVNQTIYNRGVTVRGLAEGGEQEQTIAAKCREHAALVADAHPKSARILRDLANWYEHEARRNDASAERFRRGLR